MSLNRSVKDKYMTTHKLAALAFFLVFVMVLAGQAYCGQLAENPFEQGIESFSTKVASEIASRFYDYQKRPIIRVCVLDFTNGQGVVTLGSRYIADRLKMALVARPQFAVASIKESVDPEIFARNPRIREYVLGMVPADVYVLGIAKALDQLSVHVQVSLFNRKGEPLLTKRPLRSEIKASFNRSGLDLFREVLVKKSLVASGRYSGKAAAVFLTQPIDDDIVSGYLSGAKTSGLYTVRNVRPNTIGRYQYGTVVRSHVVEEKTVHNIISTFTLLIKKDENSPAIILQPYIIPRESRYYLAENDLAGEKYPFKYLWYYPGKSDIPAPSMSDISGTFYVAKKDWKLYLSPGMYTGLATIKAIKSLYHTQEGLPEYARKFQFEIKPGRNILVVNYSCHRDTPAIYVNRVQFARELGVRGKFTTTLVESLEIF